jgi:flagellar motor switch/type III secretory pathway protein FliN
MATARVAPVKPEAQPQDNLSHAIESFHWLCCDATSEIPVPRFTVGDLLNLRKGTVVQTASPAANDVPLRINKILLGYGRFEVVGEKLAVRLTEFA